MYSHSCSHLCSHLCPRLCSHLCSRLCYGLIVGVILLIVSIVYTKYTIFDDQYYSYKPYVKWIPAGILCLLSGCISLYKIKNVDYEHAKYYIFLLWIYVFCVIGDILLSLDDKYYLFGMISFMISYILIGLMHIRVT